MLHQHLTFSHYHKLQSKVTQTLLWLLRSYGIWKETHNCAIKSIHFILYCYAGQPNLQYRQFVRDRELIGIFWSYWYTVGILSFGGWVGDFLFTGADFPWPHLIVPLNMLLIRDLECQLQLMNRPTKIYYLTEKWNMWERWMLPPKICFFWDLDKNSFFLGRIHQSYVSNTMFTLYFL